MPSISARAGIRTLDEGSRPLVRVNHGHLPTNRHRWPSRSRAGDLLRFIMHFSRFGCLATGNILTAAEVRKCQLSTPELQANSQSAPQSIISGTFTPE